MLNGSVVKQILHCPLHQVQVYDYRANQWIKRDLMGENAIFSYPDVCRIRDFCRRVEFNNFVAPRKVAAIALMMIAGHHYKYHHFCTDAVIKPGDHATAVNIIVLDPRTGQYSANPRGWFCGGTYGAPNIAAENAMLDFISDMHKRKNALDLFLSGYAIREQ